VLDADKRPESKVVFPDGRREDSGLTHEAALAFAKSAAAAFGVGQSKTVTFDKERASKDVAGDDERKVARKSKAAARKAKDA
jgi:CRISPR-associated protein Csb1